MVEKFDLGKAKYEKILQDTMGKVSSYFLPSTGPDMSCDDR